jgi:predicted esterase YcpF (UPF0227 family)
MTTTHLLYLHGFRSSPQSAKARVVDAYLSRSRPEVTLWCPQLPPSPKEAMAMVAEGIAGWPRETMAVAGSSLGGFYATWVAERMGCKAAPLNPAVDPARDLSKFIGEQTHFYNPEESFFFKEKYLQELHDLVCGELQQPQNYFCVIAKGDEVLDWREMYGRYQKCHVLLLESGDHAISDFEVHLPDVMKHLGL